MPSRPARLALRLPDSRVAAWYQVHGSSRRLGHRVCSVQPTPSGPELDDRDLLPVVQPVVLDGHRHVVGVEPHRHVELEVGGDLDAERPARVLKVTSPVVVSTDQPESCSTPSR